MGPDTPQNFTTFSIESQTSKGQIRPFHRSAGFERNERTLRCPLLISMGKTDSASFFGWLTLQAFPKRKETTGTTGQLGSLCVCVCQNVGLPLKGNPSPKQKSKGAESTGQLGTSHTHCRFNSLPKWMLTLQAGSLGSKESNHGPQPACWMFKKCVHAVSVPHQNDFPGPPEKELQEAKGSGQNPGPINWMHASGSCDWSLCKPSLLAP